MVIVKEGPKVRAIAPLVLASRHGVPTLQLLGNPYCLLCEPGGFLYADEAALQQLVDAVFSLGKPLSLDRIPSISPEARLLREQNRRTIAIKPRVTRSRYIAAEGDWEGFLTKQSKSRMTKLRQKKRAAGKMGEVTIENIKITEESYQEHMEAFFKLESSGWKGQQGTAILSNPYQHKFWLNFAPTFARLGCFYAYYMRIGGEIAVLRLMARYSGRLWDLKIAFDEKFRNCAPGVVLVQEAIQHVFESDITAFEFMGSEEAWQDNWTTSTHEFESFRFYPLTATGVSGFVATTANYLAERVGETVSRYRNQ